MERNVWAEMIFLDKYLLWRLKGISEYKLSIQGYSSGHGKGFVCFLRVPQAVGLYCSCHATQASKGNFQKKIYKTFFHDLMNKPLQSATLIAMSTKA